jgi:hypothetical protein
LRSKAYVPTDGHRPNLSRRLDAEAISKRLADDAMQHQACEAQRKRALELGEWLQWNRCMSGLPPGDLSRGGQRSSAFWP